MRVWAVIAVITLRHVDIFQLLPAPLPAAPDAVEEALHIAASICVFTNDNIIVEVV